MNILIACEESQTVCKAFRELGGCFDRKMENDSKFSYV